MRDFLGSQQSDKYKKKEGRASISAQKNWDASPWPPLDLSASDAVVVAGDAGAAVDVGAVADDGVHAGDAVDAVAAAVANDAGNGAHVAAADENVVAERAVAERESVNVAVVDGAEDGAAVVGGAADVAVAVAAVADDAYA